MQDILIYDKELKLIISRIIRTIRKYKLLTENETVAVALSGGKDSTVLLYILWYINSFSYLKFKLLGIHVQTGDYDYSVLEKLCDLLGVEFVKLNIDMAKVINHPYICYSCSRIKRHAMYQEINKRGITKIAYGHHADDAIETFLMNLFLHHNIESFPPKLEYQKLDLAVIRPLIFVREEWIQEVFEKKNLTKLAYKCPYEERNVRQNFREKVEKMQQLFPEYSVEDNIIKALEKQYDLLFAQEIDNSIKVFK